MKNSLFVFFSLLFLVGELFAGDAMVLMFDTRVSSGTTITLPLHGTVDVTVDWGDGSSDLYTVDGYQDHTYSIEGEYEVNITGTLTHYGIDESSPSAYDNVDKLLKISDFGTLGLMSLRGAFYNGSNVTEVPEFLPTTVTNLSYSFTYIAKSTIKGLESWDVQNVTDMSYMFKSAHNFNEDISSWDVRNVTNMSSMFDDADSFRRNIGNWNVGNVTNMRSMFSGNDSFNGDITEWDVSKVTNMVYMFAWTYAFNQDIGNWDVGSVTNISYMFQGADAFNQNIGNWDVSSVSNMSYMFHDADAFNQNIGNWDVTSVTNMYGMFRDSDSFNGNIGNWDVSNVRDMRYMFSNTDSFNHYIGDWDVRKVDRMNHMFYNANDYNQDIGKWDISNVRDMGYMFSGVTLSTYNYDSILINWSALPTRQYIRFHGGNSKYSAGAAETARNNLKNDRNWMISDGGKTNLSVLNTHPVSSINLTVALGTGTISNLGLSNPTQHGFCWNTAPWPITSHNKSEGGTVSTTGTFSSLMTSLTPNTTYYVRAYATNSEGTSYGPQVSFNTLPTTMILDYNTELSVGTTVTLPLYEGVSGTIDVTIDWGVGNTEIVTTEGDIHHTYADEGLYTVIISGTLTQFGKGEVYDNVAKLEKIANFGDIGLTSLSGAFNGAVNLNEVPEFLPETVTDLSNSFKNTRNDTIPGLKTWDISNVTDMEGMFEGTTLATSLYDSLLVRWGTLPVAESITFHGGSSMYSHGTPANARQVLVNKSWSITDGGKITLPIITTHSVNAIAATTGVVHWEVKNLGELSPVQHGICWGTAPLPTTADSLINRGIPTTGKLSSTLTGLQLNTQYYVRSFITDSKGTYYSNEISFSTSDPMVLEFNTTLTSGTTITLPFQGDVNVVVEWGDGSSDTYTDSGDKSHTFVTDSTYSVKISGSLSQFGKGLTYPNAEKLIKVTRFGDIGLNSLSGAFYSAINLGEVPKNLPVSITDLSKAFSKIRKDTIAGLADWNVTNVTNMSFLFYDANVFNQNIGHWNVSNVTDMSYIFYEANAFNQVIGTWNVGNVTNMSSMFYEANSFNQDIGTWNVSNVTNMSSMFYEANTFNRDIGTWNVGNVTNMSSMFYEANSFNQGIGTWNVGNVTNMSSMFYNVFSFNQDIGTWNVGNVTNMSSMFFQNFAFNQDIGTWNVGNVIDMSSMFYNTNKFNQDIGRWNVSKVTNMSQMFSVSQSFNQDIGNWDVSNVSTMSSMFYFARNFNQNIGNWNVGKVENMSAMFKIAGAFNQDLGKWNVSNVSNAYDMLYSVELSLDNYSSLLIGWDTLPSGLVDGVTFNGGKSNYIKNSPADSARQRIISENRWIISDGGPLDFYLKLSLDSTTITYTENDVPTQIDPAAVVTHTGDDSQWFGGNLTVAITANSEVTDKLSIKDNVVGTINTDGMYLKNGTTTIGTLNTREGNVTDDQVLRIYFYSNTTTELVQQTVRAIHYFSNSQNPSALDRTITVAITDNQPTTVVDNRIVSVVAVNYVPIISTNSTLFINEEETGTITSIYHLSATDVDYPDADLEFTVTSLPINGELSNTTKTIALNGSFLMSDLTNGYITYAHDGSNTTSDSFEFTVSDGTNDLTDQLYSIAITPIDDDAPIVTINTGISLSNAGSAVITQASLKAEDTEQNDSTLIFTMSTAPLYGALENSDNSGVIISSFTQQQLIDGRIHYVHNGSNSVIDSFVFSVSDSNNELLNQLFSIIIDPPLVSSSSIISSSSLSSSSVSSSSLSSSSVSSSSLSSSSISSSSLSSSSVSSSSLSSSSVSSSSLSSSSMNSSSSSPNSVSSNSIIESSTIELSSEAILSNNIGTESSPVPVATSSLLELVLSVDAIVSSSDKMNLSSTKEIAPIHDLYNSVHPESVHITIYNVMGVSIKSLTLLPGDKLDRFFNGITHGFYVINYRMQGKDVKQGYLHK